MSPLGDSPVVAGRRRDRLGARGVGDAFATIGPGRAVVTAALGIYFALLAAVGGYYRWDRLGVPGLDTKAFGDLRSITSAWECARRGISVIYLNPCDPLQRPANYPRIWLAPSALGLGQSSTLVLGTAIAVVFLVAAVAVLPARARIGDGLVYAAVLCSPSVMLGVERGNVDILLFALVTAAALLLAPSRSRSLLSSGLILLAAVLKLFPIFAIGLLARLRRRQASILCGAALFLFALYACATRGDIRAIRLAAPQQNGRSYGVNIVGGWIASTSGRLSGNAWDALLLAFLILVAFLIARRTREPIAPGEAGLDRDLGLFLAGAGVYIFTYALFRSWDYRLVFLLLTIPLLLRSIRHRSSVALLTLIAIGAATWFGSATWTESDWRIVPNDLSQLTVFVGLVSILIATTPRGRERESRREHGLPSL